MPGRLTSLSPWPGSFDGEPAVEEWRVAEAAAVPFGAYHVLRPRLELAAALLAVGERDEGRALLLDLWQSAHDMGARWFEAAAARTARRTRVALPVEERLPSRLAALTPREREVLEVLATGATNRQIADRLFISEKTVSVHVTNVLAKLGSPTGARRRRWRASWPTPDPAGMRTVAAGRWSAVVRCPALDLGQRRRAERLARAGEHHVLRGEVTTVDEQRRTARVGQRQVVGGAAPCSNSRNCIETGSSSPVPPPPPYSSWVRDATTVGSALRVTVKLGSTPRPGRCRGRAGR